MGQGSTSETWSIREGWR